MGCFSLDKGKDAVETTQAVEVSPFQTIHIHRLSHVTGHDKRFSVMTDAPKKCYSKALGKSEY